MGAGAVILVAVIAAFLQRGIEPRLERAWFGVEKLAEVAAAVPAVQPQPPPPVAEKADAPTLAQQPQPVAAAPRRGAAPAVPTGRLFEPTDVDESPTIATRVEPRLPRNVPARALNDIVVVRVLVSQTGHPFRVSLLRRSKHGPPIDDAVVAAVTQWTFSPARKEGEPVSCWYNIAVPLGDAD